MDPVTQITVGATLASCFAKSGKLRLAAFCGAIGGASPDIDVFVKSSIDSLLFIEFHRHFTHSFIFIPIGSLIVSTLIFFALRRKESFNLIYIYSFLGFATHGLIDACTTYGTMLYLPFSNERVSWNIISIVDPVFTITMLIALVMGLIYELKKSIIIGTIFCFSYLFLGVVQKENVKGIVLDIAYARGHIPETIMVNPTLGNIILWRTIYKYDGFYYVDAVRKPFFGDSSYKEGNFVAVLDKNQIYQDIPYNSRHRDDIKRFAHFSNDYIYLHPEYNNVIADLRYGVLPYDLRSLWGIKIDKENTHRHVEYLRMRDFKSEDWAKLKSYIFSGF